MQISTHQTEVTIVLRYCGLDKISKSRTECNIPGAEIWYPPYRLNLKVAGLRSNTSADNIQRLHQETFERDQNEYPGNLNAMLYQMHRLILA